MPKTMWIKTGWSDYYRGGEVFGNFEHLNEGGEGHEAFNFLPGPDGRYYVYVPPHGPYSAYPYMEGEQDDWTVIYLSKFPSQKGVHVVGWLENATLLGRNNDRPEYEQIGGFRLAKNGERFFYSVVADQAYFVPPIDRTAPFSHGSVKQAKFSYLQGPNIEQTPAKEEVLAILNAELDRLRGKAIAQPNSVSAPDNTEDESDPLSSFGTPEHRKAVEMAGEAAATKELERLGYTVVRRANENLGYDLQAIPKAGGQDLLVEVKGTSGTHRRFFMTPNEYRFMEQPGWRLAIVTDALGQPNVSLLKLRDVRKIFALSPMVWIGNEVEGTA